MDIVTLIPRLPFSANNCAVWLSNAIQSDRDIACATPSCMLRGDASQLKRRRCVANSSLQRKQNLSFTYRIQKYFFKNPIKFSSHNCILFK